MVFHLHRSFQTVDLAVSLFARSTVGGVDVVVVGVPVYIVGPYLAEPLVLVKANRGLVL